MADRPKTKVVHLELKATGRHQYFSSITDLVEKKDKEILLVGKSVLERFKPGEVYENENIIVRVGRFE